ncbi:MAG: PTS sugar transporter subunit IIA [Treponemataceae bacterium]|jgi:PTS system ascorbate-specific IIA component|nr:MAG: PTS sugar transporter subunit IIA [Treponemataceae bacterium]
MLLKEIVEQKLCYFAGEASSWQESIKLSCKALEDAKIVGEKYADEIIKCVTENGPYIVLMPGIALPHSMENSPNAFGTAIAFTKLAKPVSFDDADPEKTASVFFTLAATDDELHLKNMRKLFKMLTNEELAADLQNVRSEADVLALDAKYS